MKPKSAVPAYLLSGFQFQHIARILTEIPPDIFVIVYLSQEADALRVLALSVDKMFALGNLPHLAFHIVTYGKQCLTQLPVVNLREKIGLIFHRVGTCDKPLVTIFNFRAGIVPRSYEVVAMAYLVVKRTKLDKPVAHHVGIRGEARPHLVHRIAGDSVPILAVTVYHLQLTTVSGSHHRSHLHVFLACAVPLFLFLRAYLYIETVGRQPAACQLMHHHRTVYPA